MGEAIGFISVKGGVGKTTLALETASSLANDFGKRVLLVDGNFSSPNLGLYFGIIPEVGLHDVLEGHDIHKIIQEKYKIDIVPASIHKNKSIEPLALKKILANIKEYYDYVIIDSSPHYSEMMPAIAACDRIFVVTTPDSVTLQTSIKAAKMAKARKTPIDGIIINKIKNPNFELSLREIETESGLPVVARIRDDKKIVEALFHKKPITLHSKNHHISKEIRNFASSLCGVEEEKSNLDFFKKFIPKGLDLEREKINRAVLRQDFYTRQL
jgi:pilus assembly protein CpaE